MKLNKSIALLLCGVKWISPVSLNELLSVIQWV